MERVHFQQEQMLAELKDLVEKNIFSLQETKAIMKKRTQFESSLVRRVAKKADFLRYAAYEMGLEQLRRKRVERLNIPRHPTTISDYALVRRQFHIFERALKRFRADVGLWVQYIELAKREGARTLVGRVTARALQLHPNSSALYIIAASNELDHQSPSTARSLLQRGIRMNPESVDMWTEYVKMELGFIEGLRRRWGVLGLEEKQSAKEKDEALLTEEFAEAIPEEKQDEDQGISARNEILQGAIVKSALKNAVESLPKVELFEALNALLLDYPILQNVREALLHHFDALIRTALPDEPRVLKMLCTRSLRPEMSGSALVEGIRQANETLVAAIADSEVEAVLAVYAEFVEEWSTAAIDDNLKLYLVVYLERVIKKHQTSPSLLAAHVRCLGRREDGEVALKKSRSYTSRVLDSSLLWLARLDVEKRCGGDTSVAWAEARRSVSGSDEDVLAVWQWGVKDIDSSAWEALLKESLRSGRLEMHEQLVLSYLASPAARNTDGMVRRMEACLASAPVWRSVFELLATQGAPEAQLRETYELWRRKDGEGAGLAWAGWLLQHGKGKEASALVSSAGLEDQWSTLVAGSAY
ncbi:hypothetical protein CYLTODRAFT_400074 [Cylindrobasidium torrendii FP15055 ss-10]|uniref:U3 small nucleolar RNA-associated protein 6 N-terminal domain-containing protein n=1 Tax=Cylindrobasidium torrendii FP15055 ss-10 TaxID=1314674 RepID=A0A0D7B670_9AGAR|nr:hypothetical protein CYLTODRAFT_400074 [Cylindrobasidium torrendii FP15055 ss-10]